MIESLDPIDISCSVNYTGIIGSEIINLFDYGILNAHAGDLPRYRGNAVMAWAILNNETKIALCVHKMVGGELDAGDIISRIYKEINHNTKISEIYDWFYLHTPILFYKSIEKLREDPSFVLEKQSTAPKDILRCYPLVPEDARIDWSLDNESVIRHINAFGPPFAGAFCTYGEKVVTILEAQIWNDNEIYLAKPGQISKINSEEGSIEVITGKGKIKVNRISIDGEQLAASAFIKSIRTRLK